MRFGVAPRSKKGWKHHLELCKRTRSFKTRISSRRKLTIVPKETTGKGGGWGVGKVVDEGREFYTREPSENLSIWSFLNDRLGFDPSLSPVSSSAQT